MLRLAVGTRVQVVLGTGCIGYRLYWYLFHFCAHIHTFSTPMREGEGGSGSLSDTGTPG
jgi:hypothetical protein